MDLNEARKRIPELAGLNDESALNVIHEVYYPNIDKAALADRLGYKAPPPPVPERSSLRAVGDLGLQFGGGAVSGVRMMTDLAGADNRVSRGLRSAEDALQKLQSAAAQADKQQISAIMKEAENLGFGDQVMAGVKAFGVAPAAMIAQALGTSIPTLATAAIPGAGQAAVAARLGMSGLMGAAQGAGNVKGVIYDEVKSNPLQGETPEQTEARAVAAQEYAGPNTDQIAIGGGLGALAGSTGMERAVAGLRNGVTQAAPGMVARVGMGAAAEALPEIAQGGQEKLASNLALGREGFDVDPMAGVVTGATMEGLAGGVMGGAFGIPRPNERQPTPGDLIRAAEGVPESGPMTRAANVATEIKAQELDATVAEQMAPTAMGASLTGTDPASLVQPAENPLMDAARAGATDREQVKKTDNTLADMERQAQRDLQGLRDFSRAPADEVADPFADVPVTAAPEAAEPASDWQPGDVLNPSGAPFKTKIAAQRAAKKTPGEVVPVSGGFAVRPTQESASEPATQQADQADPFTDAPIQAQGDTGADAGMAGQPVADDANALDSLTTTQEPAANVQNPAPTAIEGPAEAQAAAVETPAPAGSDAATADGVPDAPGAGDVQADGVKAEPVRRHMGRYGAAMTMAEADARVKELEKEARDERKKVAGAATKTLESVHRESAARAATLAKQLREDIKDTVSAYQDARADYEALQSPVATAAVANPAGNPVISAADLSKNPPKANTSAEPAQETAKSEQVEDAEPFEQAGLKIRTQRIKVGDEVKTRWVVQSPENAERERKGERQIGGDRIVDTREQAIAMADEEVNRAKNAADRIAAIVAQTKADKEKADAEAAELADIDGFQDDKAKLVRARTAKILSQRLRNNGKETSRRELVRKRVADGATVQQAEEGRRLANADGSYLGEDQITKTGMDYAEFLIAKREAPAPEPAQEPAPEPKPTPTANTVFTEDAAEKARARLKAKLGRLNSGVDPEMLMDGITLAGYHIEKGARTFSAYAKAMVSDLGDGVKPFLKSWYMGVKYDPRATVFEGMDSAATVESTNVDNLAQQADTGAPENGNATQQLDRTSTGALDGAPAQDVRAPDDGRIAGTGTDRGGRGDGAGNARADDAGGNAGGSLGGDTGAVSVPGRGARADAQDAKKPRVPRKARTDAGDGLFGATGGLTPEAGANPAPNAPPIAAPQPSAQDFTITNDLALGEGGQKTKFKNNVAAIRLMQDLEGTGRMATPDEQMVLAKYVGWGGLSQAFDGDKADWAKEHAEITALMSPEDLAAARKSTRYAHYTSREIIQDGIYAALRHFGFTGGKTLEAGAGVGNFIGMMPADMRSAGRFTAIEREPFSSAIARQLYPQQSVQRADFTEFKGNDAYYDAAVGNPPFASDPQTDTSGRKHLSGLSLHNYFFAKSVDMLREGGIMAQVVTNSFMDAKGDKARKYISDRVELLGAIRLPNSAFAKNANTEVTTDLIYFKKRPDSEVGGKAARADAKRWLDTGVYTDARGQKVALNQYFIDNPSMMLGDFGAFGTMHGPDQPALVARTGQDTLAMLKEAVGKLPAGVYKSIAETGTDSLVKAATVALNNPSVKEGGYFIEGDKLMQRLPDIAGEARGTEVTPDTQWTEKTKLGEPGFERIKALAGMRSTVRGLLAAEMSDNAGTMTELRKTLNAQYDAYRDTHGLINDPSTLRVFDDDPDFPLLASLEHGYTPGIGPAAAKRLGVKPTLSTAKKGPIFTQRVVAARQAVQKVDTPADALAVSMAERGRLDGAYIGQLLGMDPDEVLRELSTGDKPLLFRDPLTDEYVLRDAYLSGNVRAKLAQAREAGMFENINALEAVQPEDVASHEIVARLGSPWVPTSVYQDFARELYGEESQASVFYLAANSSYQVSVSNGSDVAMSNTWGTKEYRGDLLLQAVMNNRSVKVTYRDQDGKTHTDVPATERANEKATEIKARFNDWIFSDPDRSELLVKAYNETNNNYVTRVYEGSNMTFPGKVPDSVIKFRRHQRNAIARIVQDRTALLDHVVGAGKTFTVISGAMELKRTGLARKPMVAVPNHLVKQWAADFYRLYPGANVLTATKKDFEKANRRKFLAKIATGDWDAVVIAHSSYGFIKPAPEFEAEFNGREISKIMATIKAVEDSDGDKPAKKRTIKQLEGMKERLENRIKALRDKPMDDLLDFEQIGVDQLFVDEAHMFKNLMYSTKMQGVAGLNDPTGSQRAYDMYVKTNQVMEKNGRGQGVVFATGTPVSNSLAEMYHMMRYLMPTQMKDLGFESFDAWANTYASVEQVWMQAPSGDGFKATNRMSNFVNTPELLKMFDQVSDTVTMDDIKKAYAEENNGAEFPLPKLKGGRRTPVSLEKSEAQNAYMDEIAKRAKAIEQRKGPPQKGQDNILVVMSDARKAAMDIRLVNPDVTEREPGGRIDRSTDEVVARYKQYDAVKGTQLVFSDLGTPLKHAKKELKEYEALQVRIQAGNADVAISANLGNESAMETMEDAEAAQAELDAMGPDWLGAVKAAVRGFSIYDDFKAALIEKGVPESEIAFIHDYNTDDQKASLFRKVNAGQIRVLLGSTAKLGAGTNVQERLVAEHHLDVPWRPSDVEQREGRIERQGNRLITEWPNFEIEILAYVTRDTLDMRMWQVQETKLKMINQLRTRKIGREIDNAFEDMELSAGEMQAAATGDINLLKEIQLRSDVKKLEQRRRSFDGQRNDLISRKRRNAEAMRDLPAKLKAASVEAAIIEQYNSDLYANRPPFAMNIDGKDYTDAKEAQAVLREKDEATEEVKALNGEVATKKAPLSVTIDGVLIKNRATMNELFSDARGDVQPLDWKFNEETYRRRTMLATGIRARVLDAIADESIQQVGMVGPYSVAVEGSMGRDGAPSLEVTLSRDGNVVMSNAFNVSDSGNAPARVVTQVENLMAGAVREANYIERSLERAKKESADLGKVEVSGDWPDQGKLDAARAAHKDILATLKQKDAAQAPGAPVAEDPATEFQRIDEDRTQADTSTNGKPDNSPNAQHNIGVLERAIARHYDGASARVTVHPYVGRVLPGDAAIREIAESFGSEAQGFDLRVDLDPEARKKYGFFGGVRTGGVVFLRETGGDRPHLAVLGHELAHELRTKKPALYNRLVDAIQPYIDMERYEAEFVNSAVAKNVPAPDKKQEEFIGEVLSDGFMDKDFWRTLGNKNPRLLRQIGNMVMDMLDAVLKKVGYTKRTERYLSDYKAVMKIAGDVMAEYGVAKAAVGDTVFQRIEPGNPDAIRAKLMDAIPQGVIDRLSDMSTSQRGFNRWWHRTVGTQLHKAKTNKQFAPVYYAVQDFMKDVSRMATIAADQAPDLLPQVDSVKDVKKLLPQMVNTKKRAAQIKEASDALFDGTLRYTRDDDGKPVVATADGDQGIVWTDAEMRERGMSAEAIAMYRQSRAAIEQSLDNLLAADVYRMLTGLRPEMLAGTPAEHTALMAKIRRAAASDSPRLAVNNARVALQAQAKKQKDAIATLKAAMEDEGGRMTENMKTGIAEATDLFNEIAAAVEMLQDKAGRIDDLKASGYAPLMRFGPYTVDVTDASGNRVHFGMYESQYAANRAGRKFSEEGLTVRQGVQSQREFELLKGVSPETAMLFADMMGMEKNEAMQSWLQRALAQQSALKRHIRRKGVEGFENDASRVVAAFITSNSRAASRALHGLRIQESVENVRDGDVKDEAIALAEYVNNPKEEAQAIRSLLFVNYIGGSIASAIVNLTQTLVQTFPYLSQFGGPAKAGARIGRAMKLAVGKIDDAELAAAVKRAEEDGVIKPQEVFQLQAEASRTMGSDIRVRAALALWGSFFQAAEVFNRRVAFIAAYQTAKEQGTANPMAFAENAVDETQGTFNKGNRPNWSRGAVGATLFTFKTFTIQYVEFLKRLPPKEKALALGVLIMLAGVRGLPFAEDAEDIVDTVAQQLGYNFTTKEQMDKFLVATLGKDFAGFLQHGASGTGMLPIDVSARLGMADLLPATALLKPSETRKEDQVLEVFGVAGSFVRDALKGQVTPIAIRNLSKGIEMYDRGIYTDTRGRKVMDVTATDAAFKAIGLQPSNVAAESRAVRSQYEKRILFTKVKGDITEQIALGMYEDNKDKVRKARERLADWNEKNPDAKIILSSSSIRRRVVEMRKDRTERFLRSTPKELRAQTREALQ